MLRNNETRINVNAGPGSGYAARQHGFNHHWGKAVCYITVGDHNMYWWTRVTVNTGITLKENTDACSPFKQYQIIRENALTLDLESMIPGNTNTVASKYIFDFRPGVIISNLHSDILGDLLRTGSAGATDSSGAAYTGTDSAYGAFVIERSSVEFTKDDFSSLRITIRSLGYGEAAIAAGAGGTYDEEAGITP